mmetsp:Transcript_40512/g.116982  ORF Transcript_40512/g.116982 Transcript_40512/m.116982 type:complete len:387 (-) Transcript_40512:251-1411(-)
MAVMAAAAVGRAVEVPLRPPLHAGPPLGLAREQPPRPRRCRRTQAHSGGMVYAPLSLAWVLRSRRQRGRSSQTRRFVSDLSPDMVPRRTTLQSKMHLRSWKAQRRATRDMNATSDAEVLAVATEAARAAGRIIAQKVGAAVVKTKAFAADLLTEVDGECEEVIRTIVQQAFPAHGFLGEETAGTPEAIVEQLKAPGWLWVVDPIDGTTNFAAGQPLSAVSIGVAKDGILRVGVIYDPFRDELFSAAVGNGARLNDKAIRASQGVTDLREAIVASGAPPNPKSAAPCFRAMSLLAPPRTRTIRVLGSAAVNFAWVACGRLDAWFEPDLNPWDSAAGALLVREAGGQVTDCLGIEYVLGTRPICASNGAVHAELLSVVAEAGATQLDV